MRKRRICLWAFGAVLLLGGSPAVDEAFAGRRGSVRARNRGYGRPRYGRDRYYDERERAPDPRETWRPAKVYTRSPLEPAPSPSTGVGRTDYYAPLPNPAEMRRQRALEKAAEAGMDY